MYIILRKKKLKVEFKFESEQKLILPFNLLLVPNCKQVVVGKIVNEHGIAKASSVIDGNTSDAEWNEKSIKLEQEKEHLPTRYKNSLLEEYKMES